MSENDGEEANMMTQEAPTGMDAAISPQSPSPPPSPHSRAASGEPAAAASASTSASTSIEIAHAMPHGFTAIGPVGGERKARDWSLVLQSIEIWHVVHHTHAGWVLLVRDQDYERSATSIDRYEVENRDWPPRPKRERPRHAQTSVPAMLFAALAAFFLITGPVASGSRWFHQGTAVTDMVLTSAPWRAVTALTLHADSAHAIGNVISGTIFASAVCTRLGPGGGSLAILASGVLGNVANAVYQHGIGRGYHASIGASTAVFGAIGLLAATQIALDHEGVPGATRSWIERIAPFVGGLALLGALGASPNADLGAHLFGLLAGLMIGLAVAFPLRWRKSKAGPWWLQVSLGAVAAGILLGSWQLAIRS